MTRLEAKHSEKPKHQDIFNAYVNKNQIKLTSKTSNTTKSSLITEEIVLDATFADKVTSAEALSVQSLSTRLFFTFM